MELVAVHATIAPRAAHDGPLGGTAGTSEGPNQTGVGEAEVAFVGGTTTGTGPRYRTARNISPRLRLHAGSSGSWPTSYPDNHRMIGVFVPRIREHCALDSGVIRVRWSSRLPEYIERSKSANGTAAVRSVSSILRPRPSL